MSFGRFMSTLRESMEAELRSAVVPLLRASSFRGSFPHFRRFVGNGIDLLTFQFDKNGGGFVIEISRCPKQGVTTHWGKAIAPKHVTAWDLHPDKRHRIQATHGSGTDAWFRYDGGQTLECAKQVIEAFTRAEEWWARHA